MRTVLASVAAVGVVTAVSTWLFFAAGHAADPARSVSPPADPGKVPGHLVVHEWGTFTSFSGADGVPATFTPNNTDLPGFVYTPAGEDDAKGALLAHDGLVSMETPVLYFYTDKSLRASVRVDFPRGWITEWYPFAAAAPTDSGRQRKEPGRSIRWDVKLLPGEAVRLANDKSKNHYYQARETDAVALQSEVVPPKEQNDWSLRGGTVVQREKFLFYRGVGAFPPPVTVKALGQGKVEVHNASGGRVAGLLLLTVHRGAVSFKALGALETGADRITTLPEAGLQSADLAEVLVKELTAAGLYEKEARAMVKTWDAAWFGEDGTRLLYLVPRTRTDELLPLTIDPKPAEVVRVLVGRHDFLTPEQEAAAERLVQKSRAAQAELQSAEAELGKIGRFGEQARQMAEKRLDTRAAKK